MVSRLNPTDENFLAALSAITDKAQRANRAISSGLRVSTASDDPDVIGTMLQTRADLAQTEQIQQNLGSVKAEVDTAEQTVSGAVSLMERVRTLGAQGATSLATPETRTSAADEIDSILKRMVSLSATQVEGRYLFSGDADSTAPYTWDSTQPYPVSAYQGSASTREILHPSGTTFAIAHTASQIFDAPGSSAFLAMAHLSASLRSGVQADINTSLTEVTNAGTYLNQQLAFYGSVQSEMSQAVQTANERQLSLKTHLSAIQDTDMTAAILDLNQANFHQQAALESRSKLPKSSLFDFMG
jgi:flagellar hook-associated protein 3 FlgL